MALLLRLAAPERLLCAALACSASSGATALHLALLGEGGRSCGDVGPERAAEALSLCQLLLAAGSDVDAPMLEAVGTGGRIKSLRPLDVLTDRLLSAPVGVPGWPYTGSSEWRLVAEELLAARARVALCSEETRVWLRKAGLRA